MNIFVLVCFVPSLLLFALVFHIIVGEIIKYMKGKY